MGCPATSVVVVVVQETMLLLILINRGISRIIVIARADRRHVAVVFTVLAEKLVSSDVSTVIILVAIVIVCLYQPGISLELIRDLITREHINRPD